MKLWLSIYKKLQFVFFVFFFFFTFVKIGLVYDFLYWYKNNILPIDTLIEVSTQSTIKVSCFFLPLEWFSYV